jgi:predicted acylesterase/phospholipase RssA
MAVDPNSVRYVVFEGGGGKGLAHIGALRALEDILDISAPQAREDNRPEPFPVLSPIEVQARMPLIDIFQDYETRTVYGVAGSSAGAITAFMAAMGISSTFMEYEVNEFSERTLWLRGKESSVGRLESFFEDPDLSGNRLVSFLGDRKEFANYDLSVVIEGLLATPVVGDGLRLYVDSKASSIVAQRVLTSDAAWVPGRTAVFRPHMSEYVNSLLFNRGLFSGFAAKAYFADLMRRRFYPKFELRGRPITKKPEEITFKDLFDLTGVDLLFTGTNVSKHRSGFFSVGYTPDFPVIDAVTISMSIPFVFKPVIVDRDVRLGSENEDYNESYKGLWVDGGILNNFPLHAYDSQARLPDLTYQGKRRMRWGGYEVAVPRGEDERPPGEERPFDERVLGVRLGLRDKTQFDVNKEYGEKNAGVLFDFAGQLLTTFLADSSDSQVRTPLEQQRVCTLDVSKLDLLDFAGPEIDEQRIKDDPQARMRAKAKRDTLDQAERTMRSFLSY